MATSYILGVSSRRPDRMVQSLGVTGLSKFQVPVMAKDLDEWVRDILETPVGCRPCTFVAADTLTMKVREAAR